ncbi:TPA: hypothetical protein EYN65_09975 [Candidatus Poribacteria bacterium]|nr:hypothetical protein [Candidatus Poribacteria bacterium]HIC02163.1 hypothetical protein [Candidatus Poribacteria bacterium]HIN30474.1 hypothetical protein [Candidatus Poribacteria bacterium]HIO49595.1 hypothetical protein [Candidatus Poribacteria bacterium]HIO79454.1 hypothetical protein [Candidatus Poribacteria bacterium]
MKVVLTDAHFETLKRDSYVIVHNFLPEVQRMGMVGAIRRLLPPWEELEDKTVTSDSTYFPYPEQCLNQAIVNPEAIRFARQWLGTEHIHYRPGLAMVRYPGFKGFPDSGKPHMDNGNNSLLPPSQSNRHHGQLNFWFYLEDVDEDQAPTHLVKTSDGQDLSRAEKFVAPGGSVAIFTNYNWHSAGDYCREDGQRYVWKFAFGRADHYWEGALHYTSVGRNPHFQEFIGSLTTKERELFRFPPVGHPYYTKQTLEALEEQYPGWNRDQAYKIHREIP